MCLPLHAQPYTASDSTIVKDMITQMIALNRAGKGDSSLLVANKALAISRSIKYHTGAARLLTNIAVVEKQRANYYISIALADSALQLYTILNLENPKAGAYNIKGSSHFELGNYEKAIALYFEALKRYEAMNRTDGIIGCYNNVALCYNHLKQYDKSLEYHQKSLAMERKENNKQGIAESLRNMGNVYHSKKEYDKAIDHFQQSLVLEKEVKNEVGQGICYLNMGLTYTEIMQYDSARVNCNQALEIFNKHKVPLYLAEAHLMKAEIHAAARQDSLAIDNYNTASNIFKKLDAQQKIGSVKEKLYQFYLQRKQYQHALDAYMAYNTIADSIFSTEKIKTITEIESQYNTEKKEQQIIQLQNQQKLTQTQLNLHAQQLQNEKLLNEKKSQQLALSNKDNEIKTLTLKQQSLAIANQKTINEKTAQQLTLLQKETQLKEAQLQSQLIKQQLTYGGALAAIAVGGYVYLLYRKRKKLSNQLAQSLTELKQTQGQLIQLEKEKEAEAIRLRISRDIHDDIGSNLTKIAMLGNITAEQAKTKMPEMTEQLEKISDYARTVNNSMSEIVWAINPKQDTLENLLGYMRTHTQEFLTHTGINHTIQFPKATPPIHLNPDLKRTLFLILKESLNNAVKYARAKNITVQFSLADTNFKMQIMDDGIGFNPTEKMHSGNGLQNMTERAKQMACNLKIQSTAGSGCVVSITGTLQNM